MKKFNWNNFFIKVPTCVMFIFLNKYMFIPTIENHIRQISLEQFSNTPNVVNLIEKYNAVINFMNILVWIIPLILFWEEIVFVFKKIKSSI